MALINCPECGKEISDKIKKCPHCGFILKSKKIPIIVIATAIIIIAFVILLLVKNPFHSFTPIELTKDNIWEYIDCSIVCEDFSMDNSKKDFLGFTNYYYSANAHIKVFPKKGKKFENVKIDVSYDYDFEFYDDLYASLGTVSVMLDQKGSGEAKSAMQCSLLVTASGTPKMDKEKLKVINVSGYVYE